MARVKMLKMAAGPEGNREIGRIYEVDDDTALAFVEAGAAELISEPTKRDQSSTVERAVTIPPETAVAPAQGQQVSRRRR